MRLSRSFLILAVACVLVVVSTPTVAAPDDRPLDHNLIQFVKSEGKLWVSVQVDYNQDEIIMLRQANGRLKKFLEPIK